MKTEEWPGLHHSCFPEVFSEMLGLQPESGFGDVLGLQKVLSRLGAFRFDIAEGERSGEASPRFIRAVERLQEQSGLKVDGLINPAGPTIKALGKRVDEEPEKASPRPPDKPG